MNDDTVTAPRWTAAQARELYNVAQWGEGYFDVAAGGHVLVRPFREKSDVAIDLYELAQRLPKEGLQLPVLVRFVNILHDRVDQLTGAFADVIAEQIGRASCRGRVCQSVTFSGGAGALKKKN